MGYGRILRLDLASNVSTTYAIIPSPFLLGIDIEKTCETCGWSLPLMKKRRTASVPLKSASDSTDPEMIPWKQVFRERQRIARNWRQLVYQVHDLLGDTSSTEESHEISAVHINASVICVASSCVLAELSSFPIRVWETGVMPRGSLPRLLPAALIGHVDTYIPPLTDILE